MTKWILAAGAAALAIASPALAERGGQGGDKGKGGQQAANAGKGGGGARAAKADRGGGKNEARSVQAFSSRGDDKNQARSVRVGGSDDRGKNRGEVKVRGRDDSRIVLKSNDRDDRRLRSVRIDGDGDRYPRLYAANGGYRGLSNDCPPGHAKNILCMPPGQFKKLQGTRLGESYQRSFLPASFRNWYPDNDEYYYREVNGYAYRIDRQRGLIDGLFPLFNNDGNFFTVGQRYPMDYDYYNVPTQYQRYYADNDDYLYRYGDGGIYQVNRSNGLIEGIAALLAGDLGVGQRLPMGYDTYNVPLGYRDQYYDTADNMYRYNDGYIYRIDPKTQLIQAVISALI